jgi:hypothetical protein
MRYHKHDNTFALGNLVEGESIFNFLLAGFFEMALKMCRWGGTPIEDAIRAHDSIIVNLLKRYGACLSTKFSSSAIFTAARHGDVIVLSLLVDSGASLTAKNYDGVRSALACVWPLDGNISLHMETYAQQDAAGALLCGASLLGLPMALFVLFPAACHKSISWRQLLDRGVW